MNFSSNEKSKTFLILSLLVAPSLSYGDPPFTANVRISDDAGRPGVNQGESSFDVFGQNVYTIANLAERSFIAMIPFARSSNRGLTWNPNLPFQDSSVGITWHTDPVIAVDDSGYLHMLVQFSTTVIRHYLSKDGGLAWIDTTDVSDLSTGGSVDKPWMIVRDSRVYVTWQEFGGSANGIRFAKSVDRGANFTRKTMDPFHPGITALDMDANGTLYLAYVSGSVYFTQSADDGNTWSPLVQLDLVSYKSGVGDRAPIPSLTAHGNGILFLTWVDSRFGTWDIRGMASLDGGTSWTGPDLINDSTLGGQCKSWTTFDPHGGLHVFWYHTPDWPTDLKSLWSVRYAYSPDSGATFSPSLRITDTLFLGYYYNGFTSFLGDYHQIVADSEYVYAVWTDGRDGDMNLYFSKALLEFTAADFVRGDVNANGVYSIGDALHILVDLFGGGASPSCLDAGDANDNGSYTLQDALYILVDLFAGGPEPPPPFSGCGVDPTFDALPCTSFSLCP